MEAKTVLILTLVLCGYLCMGAGLFQAMESSNERNTEESLKVEFTKFVSNHTCVSDEEMRDFLRTLLETPSSYLVNFIDSKDTGLNSSTTLPVWDFAGAFTFSVTVVTTIGYGHIYPTTFLGRVVCICYALLGIPLTLVVLGGIGEQLSRLSQKITKFKLRPDAPAVNKWVNMVGLVLAGVLLMFVVPSIVFNQVEDWDWFTSVYYCFTTLTTIGFGDYVAGSRPKLSDPANQNIYRIMVYVWILIGLAYISLVIKSISKMFLTRAKKVKEEALKRVNLQRLNTLTQNIQNGAARSIGKAHNGDICGNSKKVVEGTVSLGEDNNGISLVKMSNIQPKF